MYLLTQDKKTLCSFGRIEISMNLSFKRERQVCLVAYPLGTDNALNLVTLGRYSDEESAMQELRRITDALAAGAEVYELR